MRSRFDLYTRTNQFIIDGFIFAASFTLAYAVRFQGVPDWPHFKQFLLWVPYLVAARLYVNWKLGIYKFIWRYVSLNDAIAIARSLAAFSGVLLALRIFYPGWAVFAARLRLPFSIIILEYLVSLTSCLSGRALRRILYQHQTKSSLESPSRARILIIGAGQAGVRLAVEMEAQHLAQTVGFLDDNPKKIGSVINRVRVLG